MMDNIQIKTLLQKYPFLYFNDCRQNISYLHELSDEDLKYNWYNIWNGHGWEQLWKSYLKRLFDWYNIQSKEIQQAFSFLDVKEKFGTLRIYTSMPTIEDLESIVEWLSSVTCQHCGKVTKDVNNSNMFEIYRSSGTIINLCKTCSIHQKNLHFKLHKINSFGYVKYKGNDTIIIKYEDDGNGWLMKI